jgi:hypothetical protein
MAKDSTAPPEARGWLAMGQLQTRGEGDDDETGDEIGFTISGLDDLDGDDGELVYEFEEWTNGARAVLGERLALLGLEHRWEGTSLVIAPEDEGWLERVLDQVEEDLSLHVDEEEAQVAYDLAGWEDVPREMLLELLADEGIAHAMDGDELFVREEDEERVDDLVDEVLDPDRPQRSEIGGQEVMSSLFVAADRLRHDPAEHEGSVALVGAARAASTSAAPYGMERAWWEQTVRAATELASLVEDAESDDEVVREQADQLRSRLRPYV